MSKNKYNNDRNPNTSILSNIFNNVTKKNDMPDYSSDYEAKPSSMLDQLDDKKNFTNVYDDEKDIDIAFGFHDDEEQEGVSPIEQEKVLEEQSEEVDETEDEQFTPLNSVVENTVELADELKSKQTYNSSYRQEMEKVSSLPKEKELNIEQRNFDIQAMFERINSNVREATDIFNKNIEMRDQLAVDISKIEEEKEQMIADKAAFERRINDEYQRLNTKKEQEEAKLAEARRELEVQIDKLNNDNHKLEVDRITFETRKNEEYQKFSEYKEMEQQKIEQLKNEVNLEKEKLNSYRLDLEEEKRRLRINQVRLDNERNELATNLNKFNELVNNFNYGISKLPNE